MRTAILTLALALPLAARAADVLTSYTVNDTALKAAVAGTNLTFTLYTDAPARSTPTNGWCRSRT